MTLRIVFGVALAISVFGLVMNVASAIYWSLHFVVSDPAVDQKIWRNIAYDVVGAIDGFTVSFIFQSLFGWANSKSDVRLKYAAIGLLGKMILDAIYLLLPDALWSVAADRSKFGPLEHAWTHYLEPAPHGIQNGILALVLYYIYRSKKAAP